LIAGRRDVSEGSDTRRQRFQDQSRRLATERADRICARKEPTVAQKHRDFRIDHPIIITFLVFTVIGFMALASEVLKPLALAALLSFALAPIAALVERAGVPRFLSVVLTVLLALGVLCSISYKVGQELTALVANLEPKLLVRNIERKAGLFQPNKNHAIEKLVRVSETLSRTLDHPQQIPRAVPVNVVSQPSFTQRLEAAVGPYLQGLGVGVFVLILVLFILAEREELRDRIIRLAGKNRVSVTTKTMDEVGQRISRYLMTFSLVNSAFGLIVGLGLWTIGVPFAVLWGVLAALLRFIPYVGPATAAALPLMYSVAVAPGWRVPGLTFTLFVVLEVLANSVVEPKIYGKTTGVSALGLLVAAMFWTWLWGGLGLLLSTPLTVCLAVLGKSIPALSGFAIVLSEETPLDPEVRFYQRLVAMDPDGAWQIVEAELKQYSQLEVFDRVLVPTLSIAKRDAARGKLENGELAFILRFVEEWLDDVEATPRVPVEAPAPAEPPVAVEDAENVRILGVAANDDADALVLRMLQILLEPSGFRLKLVTDPETPLKFAGRIAQMGADLTIMSHLCPGGFTTARYLVRRLRASFDGLPMLVGHWGESSDPSAEAARLVELGASKVVFRLDEACAEVAKILKRNQALEAASAPAVR
jgi:predicted PurR-regulated permease PerM